MNDDNKCLLCAKEFEKSDDTYGIFCDSCIKELAQTPEDELIPILFKAAYKYESR